MKNVQFVIVIFCLSLASAYSQSGKVNLSAGVGFEPTTLMDNASSNTIPLTFKLGYQVSPLFSLNAIGGYSSTTSEPKFVNDGLAVKTTNKQSFIGLRGELKKGLGERFEVYGGGTLGFMRKDISENTTAGRSYLRITGEPTPNNPNAAKGSMFYAGFVGTTFFPIKHIGLFAEVGYGVSLLNGGVTIRF